MPTVWVSAFFLWTRQGLLVGWATGRLVSTVGRIAGVAAVGWLGPAFGCAAGRLIPTRCGVFAIRPAPGGGLLGTIWGATLITKLDRNIQRSRFCWTSGAHFEDGPTSGANALSRTVWGVSLGLGSVFLCTAGILSSAPRLGVARPARTTLRVNSIWNESRDIA